MKKLFAMILAGTLAAGTLSACGSTAVVAVPQPETSAPPASEPTTPAPQTGESAGEGAVKTGLYLGTDLSSSKPAADGEDGLAQANINLVAVTISEDGVIDECVIDAVQSKVNFDAAGAITTDLSAPVSSKNELGDAYGMRRPAPSARSGTSRSRPWPTMWRARRWMKSAASPSPRTARPGRLIWPPR